MHVGAGSQLSSSYSLHWGEKLVTRVRPPVGSVAQCIFYRAEIFSLAVRQRMLEERTEWGDLPSTCSARVMRSLLDCPHSQVSAQGGGLWDCGKRKVASWSNKTRHHLNGQTSGMGIPAFCRDCSNCKAGMSGVEELAIHTVQAWGPWLGRPELTKRKKKWDTLSRKVR